MACSSIGRIYGLPSQTTHPLGELPPDSEVMQKNLVSHARGDTFLENANSNTVLLLLKPR